MAWLLKRRGGERAGESPEPATHPSPAFAAFMSWLRTVPEPRILDLGNASGPNLDFFSDLSARLQVVGLFGALEGHAGGAARREEAPDEVFAELLPLSEAGSYDAILVWDLFNYLTQRQMRSLGARLTRLSHPGTRVMVWTSNRPRVADRPAAFRIVEDGALTYSLQGEQSRSNPRHPPGEVQMALPVFDVERSFLLRHGVQEFLFVRGEAAAA